MPLQTASNLPAHAPRAHAYLANPEHMFVVQNHVRRQVTKQEDKPPHNSIMDKDLRITSQGNIIRRHSMYGNSLSPQNQWLDPKVKLTAFNNRRYDKIQWINSL